MNLQDLKIDRAPAQASRRTKRRGGPWPFRLGLLAVLAALLWLFWTPLTGWADRIRLPKVRVLRVVASDPASVGAVRGTAANGYVVAARRAALSADTPGRIVEMLVTEGTVVQQGDVVARLFSDEYAAALARAEADTKSAEAGLMSAKASCDAAEAQVDLRQRDREAADAAVADAVAADELASKQFERARQLFADRINSQDDLDARRERAERAHAQLERARALQRSAESAVTAAESQVRVAEAERETAKTRVEVAAAAARQAAATLDKTIVRAPFSGIVVLKDAEIGEVVSPNSQGGSSARGSICTMVDFDSLEVQADVPETSLAAVALDATAQIFLDAYPERAYAGRVDRIWPTADRQKATIEVRIAFVERDERLRPDMGVRVVFGSVDQTTDTVTAAAPSILVPEDAVVEIDGKPGVFLVERDTVQFATVELGSRRSGRYVIESGLRAGQKIVLEPPTSLQSGDRVLVEG